MMTQEQNTVLVIDDEKSVRVSLRRVLESWGYSAEVADCGKAGLAKFEHKRFDMVISDLKMPDIDGIEVLSTIRRMDEHCIVLIMTAFATVDSAVEALEKGAFEYFVKPLNFKHLDIVMRRALTYRRLQLEALEGDSDNLDGIVGSSMKMNQVRTQICALAGTDLTVLILGETGTGKEIVAQAIHNSSRRKDEPFVAVNCGALPESLLENELFGHIKGAFTGAAEDKCGLFEAAAGGTIFLDEIDSASAHTQAAFLRVLDLKEFRPVGGTTSRQVDVRILVASNKDFELLVGEGKFREDLFYRLISSVITLPPLRERAEDIPALVNHFVREMTELEGSSHKRFSPKALELMTQHSWPGNVRELKHAVQRAIISSQKTIVRPADLPDSVDKRDAGEVLPTLEQVERLHVEQALRLSNWNKSEAARLLGIRRERLYSLIRKHNVAMSAEHEVPSKV